MTGVVREDSSNKPLANVEVLIDRTNRLTRTDAEGRYLLTEVPTGARIAIFRMVGYRPVRLRLQIARGDTVKADAIMVPERAQQLEPLEAAGRVPRGIGREGFEERRRLGFGEFIDSAEMRRADGRKLSDLLRGRRGLRLVQFQVRIPGPGGEFRLGPTQLRAASATGNDFDGRACWMSVYLDGIAIYREGFAGDPPDLSRDHAVSSLESIEIYRSGAEIPMEFGGSSGGCGVLVLWTRRR